MRVFYDTEFIEDGRTIDLISIGLVAEDGREYYAVNADMPEDRVKQHRWLLENVWPQLPVRGCTKAVRYIGNGEHGVRVKDPGVLDTSSTLVRPRWLIRNEVRDFILSFPDPQLWAWYAAYDHVALAQLFGRMIDLPKGMPMWTNDLKQECVRLGNPRVPEQQAGAHNALADARHNVVIARFLDEHAAQHH
jgi:hypothetical protein